MTQPLNLDSLHELLSALVDQQLTNEQNARLQGMLKESSEAREYYLDFIDVHFGLRKLERIKNDVDPISDSDRYSTFIKNDLLQKSSSNWQRYSIALLATAAAITIALLPFYLRIAGSRISMRPTVKQSEVSEAAPNTTNQGQVILAQSVQASFFGELLPSLHGSMNRDHEYTLTAGMIEMRFPTGATAIIEAPAVFLIASESLLKLQTGKCSVYAPDGAEGFQVETPLTNIVDLGTRFSVNVDETGGTDVQVVEGITEVFASDGSSKRIGKAVRLTDRQARIYTEDGGVVSQVKEFEDEQYRRELPDRIVSYKATEPHHHGAVDLVELIVQRGGKIFKYPYESMIGIELTYYMSAVGKSANPIAYSLNNVRLSVEQIVADRALNTGIINPGGSVEPLQANPTIGSPESDSNLNTPGMAIRFLRPVVNDLGPDIVLFELQTLTNPLSGDAFHISPVSFEPNLRSHTVRTFDITMNSMEAKVLENFGLMRYPRQISSLRELKEVETSSSRVHTHFRALAVGVDLSDLGYALGASVESLFIQDALDDKDSFVDPTLIVGLPAIHDENAIKE